MSCSFSRSMKVFVALILLAVSDVTSAVQVVLVRHNQTSGGGAVSTLITDGSKFTFVDGQLVRAFPPSTAIWNWDGITLSSFGLYSAGGSIGGSPFGPTILNDQIVDLSIDTSARSATATSYTCVEGTFLAAVGFNGCGDYNLGPNFTDESTTVWSGLSVSQTIGGDDIAGTNGPRTIAAFDFGLDGIVGVDGLTDGDEIMIGNGIPLGSAGGEIMTFLVASFTSVVMTIGGGHSQECSEANGATKDFTAHISHPSDDAVASVEWLLDAASIGFGENLTAFVPLGAHTIEVLVTTVLGETATVSESINVMDTTAPTIIASFTDARKDPRSSFGRRGIDLVQINADATDVCDPDPSVTAMIGIDVENGELVKIQGRRGRVTLGAEALMLSVTATDASGNAAEREEAVLPVAD